MAKLKIHSVVNSAHLPNGALVGWIHLRSSGAGEGRRKLGRVAEHNIDSVSKGCMGVGFDFGFSYFRS